MATGKILVGDHSMSRSFKDYLCCYKSSEKKERPSSGDELRGKDDSHSIKSGKLSHNGSIRSYKSTKSTKSHISNISKRSKHAKNKTSLEDVNKNTKDIDKDSAISTAEVEINSRGSPKGSAYAYDDASTSSDSDDEVLQRYQQSMQRAPSNRSVAQSHRSNASVGKGNKRSSAAAAQYGGRVERAADDDQLMSLAEKGGRDGASSAYSSGGEYDDQEHQPHYHMEEAASLRSAGAHSNRTGAEPHNEAASVTISCLTGEAGSFFNESRSVGSSSEFTGSELLDMDATSMFTDTSSVNERVLMSMLIDKKRNQTTAEYSNGAYAAGEEEEEHAGEERPGSKSSANGGDTASMSVGEHDEHLFDVSDLEREPVLISKCGNLEATFEYESVKAKMTVTVHQATEIPSKERGGANSTQVRLLLVPTKKVRYKTKIKTGDTPVYDETFTFKVPPEEVQQFGIRFRLYGCERMRRERMIGEAVVGFANLNLDTPTRHNMTLEPRSNLSHGDSKLDVSSLLSRSDSASSTQSMQHGGMPELLIGLAYNGTTGRLSAEVIKGSNFRNMAMNRAPDTYVKLTLMSPNGTEITRSKTSIRRGQPHPLFKETFMFQVALFQLADVSLMVSVYNKRSMKRKEMIGWFSLGINNSGEEELAHWNDMRESKGEQVCRWHVLLEA